MVDPRDKGDKGLHISMCPRKHGHTTFSWLYRLCDKEFPVLPFSGAIVLKQNINGHVVKVIRKSVSRRVKVDKIWKKKLEF